MSELHHECGLVAIYHLPCRDGADPSHLCPAQGPEEVSRLVPRMLLDIQNRGQLSAGMTVWNPIGGGFWVTIASGGGVVGGGGGGGSGGFKNTMVVSWRISLSVSAAPEVACRAP